MGVLQYMSAVTEADVRAVLAEVSDPETGRDVVRMDQVREVKLAGDRLLVMLGLTTHSAPLWRETIQGAEQFLRAKFPSLAEVSVQHVVHQRAPEKLGEIGLTVKSVIAVGSGKG